MGERPAEEAALWGFEILVRGFLSASGRVSEISESRLLQLNRLVFFC